MKLKRFVTLSMVTVRYWLCCAGEAFATDSDRQAPAECPVLIRPLLVVSVKSGLHPSAACVCFW